MRPKCVWFKPRLCSSVFFRICSIKIYFRSERESGKLTYGRQLHKQTDRNNTHILTFTPIVGNDMECYSLFYSIRSLLSFLRCVLLQEQALVSRYGSWIRTRLWRIEGWDSEIAQPVITQEIQRFNPHVADLRTGYTWRHVHIFKIFLHVRVYQRIMPPKLSNPLKYCWSMWPQAAFKTSHGKTQRQLEL